MDGPKRVKMDFPKVDGWAKVGGHSTASGRSEAMEV